MGNTNNLTLAFSPRFKNILQRIKNKNGVSNFLLNLDNNGDYSYPFSYIDVSENNDQVTYITSSKHDELCNESNYNEALWSSKKRSPARLGRLIVKICPFFTNKDIEDFVSLYKSEFSKDDNIKFKIVEGNDIIKYYSENHYVPGRGSLNRSCMRHDGCLKYMTIYEQNPNSIQMVILVDTTVDRIVGRALLWKLSEPSNTYFMDRIYTNDDSIVHLFKQFAEKNGWLYKSRQTFDNVNVIKNDEELFIPMKANIGGKFDYFPYMDTLLYYNQKDNYLTNNENDYLTISDVIKLRETNGTNSGNENFVYDVLNKLFININDAVYCMVGDLYTHRKNAFYLDDIDEYAIPQKLRYSNHYKKFLTSDNSVYSSSYKSFLPTRDTTKVFFSMTESDFLLKDDIDKKYATCHKSGRCYSIDLMIKSEYSGKWFLKIEYDPKVEKDMMDKRKVAEKKLMDRKKEKDSDLWARVKSQNEKIRSRMEPPF